MAEGRIQFVIGKAQHYGLQPSSFRNVDILVDSLETNPFSSAIFGKSTACCVSTIAAGKGHW